MRFPRIADWLLNLLVLRVQGRRAPDFMVGADSPGGAYLRRWWLIPRNPVFNIYLHQFLRDDDDRALHDHPWPWVSFLLGGSYIEHTIARGGIHHRQTRHPGSLKVSGPRRAHRIELLPFTSVSGESFLLPCWTIFITGPRLRGWGFHCPERGWVPWQRFTAEGKPGEVGPGCDA